MRRLNVKLVVIMTTTCLLTIVLVAIVHGWQVVRTAGSLKDQAKEAEDEGDLEKATSLLSQYVAYVPDAEEEGAKLALLMADIAEKPGATGRQMREAYNALEEQLRRHNHRNDLRRRLVDYTMRFGRFSDATDHIKALLNNDENDAELLTKLGTCQLILDHKQDAKASLEKARAIDPHQQTAYVALATLLRERLDSPEEADRVIEQMVEQNPENAKAMLDRSRYLMKYYQPTEGRDVKKQIEQAEADVKRALELAPDDADVLLAAAQVAIRAEKYDDALKYLGHGNELYPENDRILEVLVALKTKDKKFSEASELLGVGKKAGKSQSGRLLLMNFELMLQQQDMEGARKLVADTEKDREANPADLKYMQAYLAFAEGKWLDASQQFERLRPMFPNLDGQISLILGKCYEMLSQPDRQLEAYEQAVIANSHSIAAIVGLARSQKLVGQNDKAKYTLERLKTAMGLDEFVRNAQARIALLELLLQRMNQLPEAERDWKEVDELVEATRKAYPDAPEMLLLESTIREQKGDRDEALQMLEQAVAKSPKDVGAWLALARLAFLKDGPQGALPMLDRADKQAGDSSSLRQARIAYASQIPPEEAGKVLSAASVGLDKFAPDEQERLWRSLGVAYFRTNDLKSARLAWTKVAEKKPNDPIVQFTLFDIAVREGDEARIKQCVDQIKLLFGSDGPEAKFAEARRLVALVRSNRSGDVQATLQDARRLVQRASEQRHGWAALARFEGEIELLAGRYDAALEHFKRAFDELGDTDIATARQIAQLLILRGRGEEARHYMQLASAKGSTSESDPSQMIDVGIALTENDIPKAIKLLEQARQQDPDNVQKTIALSQLMSKIGRFEESEALLREVVEKQPTSTIGWFELVQFLASSEQKRIDDARQVIADAEKNVPKKEVDILCGQCYEKIHDLPTAEKYFIQARDNNPNDLGMVRALATFYLRTKNEEKAVEQLNRLMESKVATDTDRDHVGWANRELAQIISADGTYSSFRKAMDRLAPKGGKQSIPLADKVQMARLLSARPEADSRIQATQMLEEIKRETTMPGDGQLLLARLYEITGNWPKAREEMLGLLGRVKDNPSYIAVFVEMLLRNDDLEAAQTWLTKLVQISPDATTTAALRARVLVKQGKPEEAVALLRNLLPRPMPREKLRMLGDVARLLEDIGQVDAAEAMFREYVALEPAATLHLAGFVGRNGSIKDSLDICQTAIDAQLPIDVVIREALQVLRQHQADATKEDYRRVETWITRGMAKNKDLVLQLNYTELLDMQGRYPELEERFKNLLGRPDVRGFQRAFVLNNLAYLLAVQNKPGEARQYIDEAVQIFGPMSDLCDTRAIVHMLHGEAQEAVDDLNTAIVDAPTGLKYFHLARAQQMAKNPQAAYDALKKAVETYHLKITDLPPLERSSFKQLSVDLGLSLGQADVSDPATSSVRTK